MYFSVIELCERAGFFYREKEGGVMGYELTAPIGWHCYGCNTLVPNGISHKCVRSIAHPEPIITNGGDVPAPPAVGWRCPSCRSVWGPKVEGCKVCNKSEINT